MRLTSTVFSLGLLLSLSLQAFAQAPGNREPNPGPAMCPCSGMGPGPGLGRPMGPGPGMRPGPGLRGDCMKLVMHAPPELLKSQLGLKDDQVSRLVALRTNFLSKRITYHAEMEQLKLQLENLHQADLPDLNKVLDLQRKVRGIKGKLDEERIKAHIKSLEVMTKEQRTQLRSQCPRMAPPPEGGAPGFGRRGGRGGHGRHGW
jgi:periplasmic protein CpxP/Spy